MDGKDSLAGLGRWVTQMRVDRGMNKKELAAALHVTPAVVTAQRGGKPSKSDDQSSRKFAHAVAEVREFDEPRQEVRFRHRMRRRGYEPQEQIVAVLDAASPTASSLLPQPPAAQDPQAA